ncbi:hypothetical protein RCL1_006805 [Eukaryota sp. TZLM3-RCL]
MSWRKFVSSSQSNPPFMSQTQPMFGSSSQESFSSSSQKPTNSFFGTKKDSGSSFSSQKSSSQFSFSSGFKSSSNQPSPAMSELLQTTTLAKKEMDLESLVSKIATKEDVTSVSNQVVILKQVLDQLSETLTTTLTDMPRHHDQQSPIDVSNLSNDVMNGQIKLESMIVTLIDKLSDDVIKSCTNEHVRKRMDEMVEKNNKMVNKVGDVCKELETVKKAMKKIEDQNQVNLGLLNQIYDGQLSLQSVLSSVQTKSHVKTVEFEVQFDFDGIDDERSSMQINAKQKERQPDLQYCRLEEAHVTSNTNSQSFSEAEIEVPRSREPICITPLPLKNDIEEEDERSLKLINSLKNHIERNIQSNICKKSTTNDDFDLWDDLFNDSVKVVGKRKTHGIGPKTKRVRVG